MEDDDKISFPSISEQKSAYWYKLRLLIILELGFIVILVMQYL